MAELAYRGLVVELVAERCGEPVYYPPARSTDELFERWMAGPAPLRDVTEDPQYVNSLGMLSDAELYAIDPDELALEQYRRKGGVT